MGRGSRAYLDPFALQGRNRIPPSLSYTNLASNFRTQTLPAIFFAFVVKTLEYGSLRIWGKRSFHWESSKNAYYRIPTHRVKTCNASSMLLCAVCARSEYVWEILGALVRACTIFKREGKRIPWWNRISKNGMWENVRMNGYTVWAQNSQVLLLTAYPWHSQPTMFAYYMPRITSVLHWPTFLIFFVCETPWVSLFTSRFGCVRLFCM